MHENDRIFIAGHQGLVGSTVLRKLQSEGYRQILIRSRTEVDLTRQSDVESFFAATKPEVVILAAGKVGGIQANSIYPVDFIRDNLLIQANVIEAAYRHKAQKFIFLGSSCIYPKFAPQPLKEEYLLTSSLEPTNESYAIAKIAGIKMCQAYRRQYNFNSICIMPTNLYGPHDKFDLLNSHVLPALLRKFHEAKIFNNDTVTIWGSGTPRREFLHVEDLADACLFLLKQSAENIDDTAFEGIINVGFGTDISILELAELLSLIIGFEGQLKFDSSKPDGTPQKLLDSTRITKLGWKAKIPLRDGVEQTYNWYKAIHKEASYDAEKD